MSRRFSKAGDYYCSICKDIFKDPVVLTCSHNFCKDCLKRRWSRTVMNLCPLCKKISHKDPPRNWALKNLCDSVTLNLSMEEKAPAGSEDLCSLHSEKLKLFCLDHQQPVCVVCRDSRAHTNHRFSPIDEAAEDYKKELRQQLKSTQDQIKHCIKVQFNWDQTAQHIKAQTQTTESQIREKFKRLQYFLTKEEEARVSALRREEEQKIGMMRIKILTLSRQIESLSDTIKSTEQVLQSERITFLKNYQAALEKVKQRPPVEDSQLGPGALIDVAKHLGNLTYNIWNKMKEVVSYSPVILDPNTAGSNLFVFDDLKHVLFVEQQSPLPQNPERFERHPMVLGSKGFNSGTHSWDVEVRSDKSWAVGVIRESASKNKGNLTGYWELQYCDGVYKVSSPPDADEFLFMQEQLQRIRVTLNWEKGTLSFFDLGTNTHLYTFYQAFTERVFPYINTINTKQLSILPKKVMVQFEM
ncbi:tripartite motif-containing protein 35-like [Notolabrus celidotus]|uniref:tripartite motif-containing protein 35-like n=1 Tax=Notolabrus celidotus TaxID=1203425 RepID=UPI00148FF924|nr:tripartite motif-containing protein 35-like [Notolabrus celidotus]